MRDSTLVTVGIPAFNAESFLGRAVASVRAQNWPIAEILVVDDGSTDDTTNLAKSLDCRVVTHARNKGDAGARNTVLAHAMTSHVACLDADDEWLPDHLETVAPVAFEDGTCAAAYGLTKFVPSNIVWRRSTAQEAGTALLEEALHRCLLPQNAVVLNRAIVLGAGGYREHLRVASDFDLWCRLASRYNIRGVNKVTAIAHEHPAQSSRKGMTYHAMEYLIREEFVDSPEWPRRLGVTREWLRGANHRVWQSHLETAWHTRDLRALLWNLRKYPGHGRPASALRGLAMAALLPIAACRDRLRNGTPL